MTLHLPTRIKNEIRLDLAGRVLWSAFGLGIVGVVLYNFVALACAGLWSYVAIYAVYMVVIVFRLLPALAFQVIDIAETKYLLHRQYGTADVLYSRAIPLFRKMPGARSRYLPGISSRHTRIKMYLHDYESAELIARQALNNAIGERWQQANLPMYHAILGATLIAQDRIAEADAELQKAVRLLDERPKMLPFYKAYIELQLGSLHLGSNDPESIAKADLHFRTARTLFELMKLPHGVKRIWQREAIALCDLARARAFAAKGEMSESERFFDKFVESIERDPRILTPVLLRKLNSLGQLYIDHGSFAKSERVLDLAYEIGRNSPHHPDAIRTLDCFEKLLLLTDRQSEVNDMRKWLRVDHRLILP